MISCSFIIMWKAAEFEAQTPLATAGMIAWRPQPQGSPNRTPHLFALGWAGSNSAAIFSPSGSKVRGLLLNKEQIELQ